MSIRKAKTINANNPLVKRHSKRVIASGIALFLLPSLTFAQLQINNNVISWPDDGWYQVQDATDHSAICNGKKSCWVAPGTYNVINHTLGIRYENIVIANRRAASIPSSTNAPASVSLPVSVNGNVIRWPDNGWYQVQSAGSFEEICAGTQSCTVEPGTYIVINHSTGDRYDNIQVSDGQTPDAGNDESSSLSTSTSTEYQIAVLPSTPIEPQEILTTPPQESPVQPPVSATIDRILYGKSAGFSIAGDINRDGVEDVVIGIGDAGHQDGAFLAWFDLANNERHNIATYGLSGYIGDGAVADMDGDGDLDVIIPLGPWLSSDSGSGSVVWYEQTPSGWQRRTIASGLAGHHYGEIRVADLDSDGALDVVVRNLSPDNIHTFLRRGIRWAHHVIPAGRREGLDVADLDSDGFPDIIGNGFVLFADDPATGRYTKVIIDQRWSTQDRSITHLVNSTKSAAADIDGDGRLDLVVAQAEGIDQPILWYQSPARARTDRWIPRLIEQGIRTHQVILNDVDDDGDIDLIGGESWGGMNRYLWSNNGVGGFTRSLISSSGGCYNCVIVGSELVGPTSFAKPVLATPLINVE